VGLDSKDIPASFTRTLVPFLVAWVSTWLPPELGFTDAQLTTAAGLLVGAAWFVGARVLEVYVHPLIGRLLLGLGVFGAPSYGRHEVGRAVDEGSARPGAVAAVAAVLLLVPAGVASADRPAPAMPVSVGAGVCDGALVVTFDLARLDRRALVGVLDDGAERIEVLDVSGRSGPDGRWQAVSSASGGEGVLRWAGWDQAGSAGEHYLMARVVRTDPGRVVSLPSVISDVCPL